MEIERINENTIKFYISYVDIEERGFEKEEIWYNRERSEQLFWQMMDEVNYKEEFNVEGPLWIQVQAMEKGLEIMVTKAQISKNGEKLELPIEDGSDNMSIEEKMENLLEEKFGSHQENHQSIDMMEENLWMVVIFNEFEDVIQLSHAFQKEDNELMNTLYYYNNNYYLYIEFMNEDEDDEFQEDIISQILEFAEDTDVTPHVLEEYGKKIIAEDTLKQIKAYFPA